MTETSGSQLAALIQSAVEALAARGFDPRRPPLDLPADAAEQLAERIAAASANAGELGLKAVSLLTALAQHGIEKLSTMDLERFNGSELAGGLEELLRRTKERQAAKWF